MLIHLSKKCDVSKKKCDISKVYSSEKRDIIKQVLRHVAVEVKLETMTDRLTNASSNRPTTNMRGHVKISLQTNKDDNERGTISYTIRHEASTTGYSFPLSVVFRQSVVTVELLNALRNHV